MFGSRILGTYLFLMRMHLKVEILVVGQAYVQLCLTLPPTLFQEGFTNFHFTYIPSSY